MPGQSVPLLALPLPASGWRPSLHATDTLACAQGGPFRGGPSAACPLSERYEARVMHVWTAC